MDKTLDNEDDCLGESFHPLLDIAKQKERKQKWLKFFDKINERSMVNDTEIEINKLGNHGWSRRVSFKMPVDMMEQWIDNCTNSDEINLSTNFDDISQLQSSRKSTIPDSINEKESMSEETQSFYNRDLKSDYFNELFTSKIYLNDDSLKETVIKCKGKQKRLYTAQEAPFDLEAHKTSTTESYLSKFQSFRSNKSREILHSSRISQKMEGNYNKNRFIETETKETQKSIPVNKSFLLKNKCVFLECRVQLHRLSPLEIYKYTNKKLKYNENTNENKRGYLNQSKINYSVINDTASDASTDINCNDDIFDKSIKKMKSIHTKDNILLDSKEKNKFSTKAYCNTFEDWGKSSNSLINNHFKNLYKTYFPINDSNDFERNNLPLTKATLHDNNISNFMNSQVSLDKVNEKSNRRHLKYNLLSENDCAYTETVNINSKENNMQCFDSVIPLKSKENVTESNVKQEIQQGQKRKLSDYKESNSDTSSLNICNFNSVVDSDNSPEKSELNKSKYSFKPVSSSESDEEVCSTTYQKNKKVSHAKSLKKNKLNNSNLNNDSSKKVCTFIRINSDKYGSNNYSSVVSQSCDKNSVFSKSNKNGVISSLSTISSNSDNIFLERRRKTSKKILSSNKKIKLKRSPKVSRKIEQCKQNDSVDLNLFSGSEDSLPECDLSEFKNKILSNSSCMSRFSFYQQT